MCMHARTRARKARCNGTCMMHQLLLYPPPLQPPVSSAPCAAQSATKSRFLLRVRPQGRRPGAGRQEPHQRTNCALHKAPARQRSCPRGVVPMPTQIPAPLTRGHAHGGRAQARAVGRAADRPSRGRVRRSRTERQALPRTPRPNTVARTCAAPSDSVRSIDETCSEGISQVFHVGQR
jgi:hypothetical protein